jgi:hypothetical protein
MSEEAQRWAEVQIVVAVDRAVAQTVQASVQVEVRRFAVVAESAEAQTAAVLESLVNSCISAVKAGPNMPWVAGGATANVSWGSGEADTMNSTYVGRIEADLKSWLRCVAARSIEQEH